MRVRQRASSSCYHRCHGRHGRSPRATARQSPWSGECPATHTSVERSSSTARTPPTIRGGSPYRGHELRAVWRLDAAFALVESHTCVMKVQLEPGNFDRVVALRWLLRDAPLGARRRSHTRTHTPSESRRGESQAKRLPSWPCGRFASVAPYSFALDALKRACRSSSLQASRSARSALSGCRRRW